MNKSILVISENISKSNNFILELQENSLKTDSLELNSTNIKDLEKIQRYALIIFDIHIYSKQILPFIEKLREQKHIYLFFLSPSNQEQDCLDAFSVGVDDYLQKPFIIAECIARIKALLRRFQANSIDEAILTHGEIVLNCFTRQALLANTPLNLTNSEFNILEIFLRYPGRVLSKEQLTEYSLGRKYTAYDRSIDVHVSNLRHKLTADHQDESSIETIRGYGYAFIAKG